MSAKKFLLVVLFVAVSSVCAADVVPVTWKPSPDNLIIQTEEARELYTRIKRNDYPSIEELKNSKVLAQIDELSEYYTAKYGFTHKIDTPERKELRRKILEDFLAIGSARFDVNTKHYVYDGPLEKNFQLEIVTGLPASGKSTLASDPDSEKMKAFILDCDVIKTLLPEFRESYGCAANSVHTESQNIMDDALKEFTTGRMKGTNVIIPVIGNNLDVLMTKYIKPFEAAGYNVRVVFIDCPANVSAARNLARELETGRIINSEVIFYFCGSKPEKVYNVLKDMINSHGLPYGLEEELEEAA